MELRVWGAVTMRMSQQRSSRFMPGPSRVQSAKVTEKSSPGQVHTPPGRRGSSALGPAAFPGAHAQLCRAHDRVPVTANERTVDRTTLCPASGGRQAVGAGDPEPPD